MAVTVIDTIKPKNQGSFPVVEAADVKVDSQKRLSDTVKYIDDTITYLTPEMFGAVGDGITNDSAAFQRMFDDVVTSNKKIKFNCKRYYLAAPVNIKSTVFIEGENAELIAPNGGLICTAYAGDSEISNFSITGNSEASEDTYGLYLGGQHMLLSKLIINNYTYGLYITSEFRNANQTGVIIDNCHIRYTNYALYVHDTGNYTTDYTITNCTLSGSEYGLYTENGIGYLISNVHTWGAGTKAGIYIENANFTHINNCYIETCAQYGIYLGAVRTGAVLNNITYRANESVPFIYVGGKTTAPNSQRITLSNIYIDNRANSASTPAIFYSGDGNKRVLYCSDISFANDYYLYKVENTATATTMYINGTLLNSYNLSVRDINVANGGYGLTLHEDSQSIRIPCDRGVSFNLELFVCSRDNSNNIASYNYVQGIFSSSLSDEIYYSEIDMSEAHVDYAIAYDTNSKEIVLTFSTETDYYISINVRPTRYIVRFEA